ncbi:MAG: CinA family nicotinamide mononucleotide deamidase-related protein [Spirochaetales bacterium]|nr:CinA family nicotinamide mononucleotide deamidase-related protein [Candidatus Physcosoma equi]
MVSSFTLRPRERKRYMSKASLIVIGTELTRGIIQDKHTQLVARELTHMGIHMSQAVAVPDDGTIRGILSSLIKNNDIVIVTGGLGPTSDDMTRAVIAEASGRALVRDEGAWNHLLETLKERAYGANEKQAYIPEGFTIIPNPMGTAPGFYGMAGETLVISMPGPPREMQPMFYSSVLPLVREHLSIPEAERDEYSSFITGESKLEELCREADPDLDWGTRFQDYKVSLYVSGRTKEERDKAIHHIQSRIGKYRLVEGECEALGLLTDLLKERGETIGCAESCTGGLAASILTSQAGSSVYMMGSVTSYAYSVKENVLGVPKAVLEEKGAVSEETAFYMAEGACRVLGSDYAFSVTGVAGPDKSEGKEVGTVVFGFAGKDKKTETVTLHFPSYGRESIRRRSSTVAFLLMRAYIQGESVREIAEGWKIF